MTKETTIWSFVQTYLEWFMIKLEPTNFCAIYLDKTTYMRIHIRGSMEHQLIRLYICIFLFEKWTILLISAIEEYHGSRLIKNMCQEQEKNSYIIKESDDSNISKGGKPIDSSILIKSMKLVP